MHGFGDLQDFLQQALQSKKEEKRLGFLGFWGKKRDLGFRVLGKKRDLGFRVLGEEKRLGF